MLSATLIDFLIDASAHQPVLDLYTETSPVWLHRVNSRHHPVDTH